MSSHRAPALVRTLPLRRFRGLSAVIIATLIAAILPSALAVPAATAATADTTLVATGSTWRYNDKGVDLGTGWRGASYDDSAWAQGPTQIGYGDGDEATKVTGRLSTYYLRRTFSVADAAAVTGLTLRMVLDDGAAVYINGSEVWRQNLAAGATYATFANTYVAGLGESVWNVASLPTGVLRTGNNVIAVEVHNDSFTSSDISFDTQLVATTTTSATVALPAAPVGLTAAPQSSSSIAVAWTPVSGATSYDVYRNGTKVTSVGQPSFTDTGLQTATTYSYAVSATTSAGTSPLSASVSATTLGEAAKVMCRIDNPALPEISGLIHSLNFPGILWVNNDSGDKARIYAIDSNTCALRATVTLAGVTALDFEAVSMGRDESGRPELWVADMGDNGKARPNVALYRFPEPTTLADQTVSVKTITVTWTDGPHDCESLIVEPTINGRVFVISKEWTGGFYQLQGDFRTTGTATTGLRLSNTRSYATDAAVTVDRSRTIVRFGNYGTIFDGYPGTNPRNFMFPTQAQGEAVTFTPDGRYVFIASEGATDLIRIPVSSL